MTVTVCWFRRNLRVTDNAALADAATGASAVVPLFVHHSTGHPSAPGVAGTSWLNRSLLELDAALRARGSRLITRSGLPASEVHAVANECGALRVHCQRDWTPSGLAEEQAVRDVLAASGIELTVAEGQLLVAPDAITTREGRPFRVFSAYHKAFARSWQPRTPLGAPGSLPLPARVPASSGPLSPGPGGPDIGRWWRVGEAAALERLDEFVAGPLADYSVDRDRPDLRGTSELSCALAWGEISPAQILVRVADGGAAAEPFVRQLAWREFAYHLLYHVPTMLEEPLHARFSAFPWNSDDATAHAWRKGSTGYPLVDAGMRQLAATGWMHNRVRMVCASFLTKHLLQPWQDGAAYFHARLADYDAAANAFNWQWVAGCGADAAPYFRIFNPTLQGTRFDPDGSYVRRWVPELQKLEARWIHEPSRAPEEALARAGIRLGSDYPHPIVDHAEARARALAAYDAIRDR